MKRPKTNERQMDALKNLSATIDRIDFLNRRVEELEGMLKGVLTCITEQEGTIYDTCWVDYGVTQEQRGFILRLIDTK